MDALEALLFTQIIDRLPALVPAVRYIEQDMGQLENYELRPPVSWPCCLVDFDDFDFSDAGNDKIQVAEGFVQIRVGLVQYTASNNLLPENLRANALQYLDTAEKIINALHGWAPVGFGKLLLRKSVTEKRDDDIRVKILRFAISYKVNRTPARQIAPRPGAVIGSDVTS